MSIPDPTDKTFKKMASMSDLPSTKANGTLPLTFRAKFQGSTIEVPELDGATCCVLDLKRFLEDETSVPVSRQK